MEEGKSCGRYEFFFTIHPSKRSCFPLAMIVGCVLILLMPGQLRCLVDADVHYYDFVLKEINVTRLCTNDTILTVNGEYPGPEIRVRKGDTVYVNVMNQGHYGVTLHWHGVKQPRNPWSDGPVFITQCPIQPGENFTYEVIFSEEEGTLWWHAHSEWTRATVHGAISILPKEGSSYPFPEPDGDAVIVLGAWYVGDLYTEITVDMATYQYVPLPSGYVINGELGHFTNCSTEGIFSWSVDYGKTYLLRIVGAANDDEMFFAIAGHNLTVVGKDASYVKPFETNYLTVNPGDTIDVLLTANQAPDRYYMASRQFVTLENETANGYLASAILEYKGVYNRSSSPHFPEHLPQVEDMKAAVEFTGFIRSLANDDYPVNVPINVTTRMFITVSMGELCPFHTDCDSHDGVFMTSTMNNVSWSDSTVDILQAYYRNISGYYTTDFPDWPTMMYNFTELSYNDSLAITAQGRKVKVLNYNESVEIVFQGTNLLAGAVIHPMHMHGYSFYVVGSGSGNFDNETDPFTYNLVDPPYVNNFGVPRVGWLAIRFYASNPGVWLWHCHFDHHLSWGMDTVFIVKNGDTEEKSIRPPPSAMPVCTGRYPDYNILAKRMEPNSTDQYISYD